MSEITMKPVSLFLLMLLSLPTLAGQVIVNQGMSTADTFALRDQLAREHEWQVAFTASPCTSQPDPPLPYPLITPGRDRTLLMKFEQADRL